jgi:hypothetical protein
VRVELALANGEEIWAQLPREYAEELELSEGQIINVRPKRTRTFSGRKTAAAA